MRSGHFEAIWSSLAPLLAKLAYCPEGFLGLTDDIGISVYRSSWERSVSFEPRAGRVSPRQKIRRGA